MTLFEKWKRATRRRFRASYKRTLQVEREKMQKQIDDLNDQHARQVRALRDEAARVLHEERGKSVALAKEVARIRFEYGPEQFGTRFTVYATMCERFIMYSRDLKEHMSYIVELLMHMVKKEFAQIDFSRVKPVDPRPGDKYPVYRIEPTYDPRSW